MKNLIIIPARLESTRLPNKALADINGEPMIVHVYKRAIESGIADVLVAAGNEEIKIEIEKIGGKAILTNPNHPSGSDRICEAMNLFDPSRKYDFIINLQGDLPNIDKESLIKIIKLLEEGDADISTLGAKIDNEDDFDNPNVVKAYIEDYESSNLVKDFIRQLDGQKKNCLYHHIGIYGYTREALEKFVSLRQTKLEVERKLEQLRAIENGMNISLGLTNNLPIGVDTESDLKRVREIMEGKIEK